MALTPVVDAAFLQSRFGSDRVVQIFDDDGDGSADSTKLTATIAEGTSMVFNFLRRGWGASAAETLLSDPVVKGISADLIVSIGMKGRPEFVDASGKNPWTGLLSSAARKTLEDVAAARVRLEGEEDAGAHANVGGRTYKPDPVFMFAQTNSNRSPGGGY